MMRADLGRVSASDQTGATRGAHGRMRECASKPRALPGEAIDIGRDGSLVSVTSQMRPQIFTDYPDDIGAVRRGNANTQQQASEDSGQ